MTIPVLLSHVAARWAVTRDQAPVHVWVPDESETDMAEYEITGSTSDGHHTFDELYEYRMLYNAHAAHGWVTTGIPVVKSWRHSGGQECFGGGWFIVTAQLPTGQVSNHYQATHWGLFNVPEVETAPEWDGHTPADAAYRLRGALPRRYHGMTEQEEA